MRGIVSNSGFGKRVCGEVMRRGGLGPHCTECKPGWTAWVLFSGQRGKEGVVDRFAFRVSVCVFILFCFVRREGLKSPVYEHSYSCIFLHIMSLLFSPCKTKIF